jgi:hypothetical protein
MTANLRESPRIRKIYSRRFAVAVFEFLLPSSAGRGVGSEGLRSLHIPSHHRRHPRPKYARVTRDFNMCVSAKPIAAGHLIARRAIHQYYNRQIRIAAQRATHYRGILIIFFKRNQHRVQMPFAQYRMRIKGICRDSQTRTVRQDMGEHSSSQRILMRNQEIMMPIHE